MTYTIDPQKDPTPAKPEPGPDKPVEAPKLPTPEPGNKVIGGVINGHALSLPKPSYPSKARRFKLSESVSMDVLIDEQGNVISVSAKSGHPLLLGPSAQAACGAKFTPTLLSGVPVKVSGVITYNFVP